MAIFVVILGAANDRLIDGIVGAVVAYLCTFLVAVQTVRASGRFRMLPSHKRSAADELARVTRRETILIVVISGTVSLLFWALVYPKPGEFVVTTLVVTFVARFLLRRHRLRIADRT